MLMLRKAGSFRTPLMPPNTSLCDPFTRNCARDATRHRAGRLPRSETCGEREREIHREGARNAKVCFFFASWRFKLLPSRSSTLTLGEVSDRSPPLCLVFASVGDLRRTGYWLAIVLVQSRHCASVPPLGSALVRGGC